MSIEETAVQPDLNAVEWRRSRLLRKAENSRNLYVDVINRNRESQDNTVLLLGTPGSGKSAFINTYCAAVYGRRTDVAREGSFCEGEHVTLRKTDYLHRKSDTLEAEGLEPLTHEQGASAFQNRALPNFRDFAGFEDQNTPQQRKLIRALLYNTLPEGVSLDEIHNNGIEDYLDAIKPRKKCQTHRVFFVWAVDTPPPLELITAIKEVCRPQRGLENDIIFEREFRLFLVITKMDRITNSEEKEKFDKHRKQILQILQLSERSVLEVTNYSSPMFGVDEIVPEIDIKLLKFMARVMHPENKPSSLGDRYATVEHTGGAPNRARRGKGNVPAAPPLATRLVAAKIAKQS